MSVPRATLLILTTVCHVVRGTPLCTHTGALELGRHIHTYVGRLYTYTYMNVCREGCGYINIYINYTTQGVYIDLQCVHILYLRVCIYFF